MMYHTKFGVSPSTSSIAICTWCTSAGCGMLWLGCRMCYTLMFLCNMFFCWNCNGSAIWWLCYGVGFVPIPLCHPTSPGEDLCCMLWEWHFECISGDEFTLKVRYDYNDCKWTFWCSGFVIPYNFHECKGSTHDLGTILWVLPEL